MKRLASVFLALRSGTSASLNSQLGIVAIVRLVCDLSITAISLVLAIVTARLLGPSGRGDLTLVITISGLAYLLGNLGIGSSNIFFSANRSLKYEELLGNSLLAGIAFGTATAILTGGLFHLAPSLVDAVPRKTLYIALAFFPLSFVELYLSFLIVGRQRLIASNVMNLLTRVVSSTIVIIGVLVVKTVDAAVLLLQSYSVLRLCLNCWYMSKTGLFVRPRLNVSTLRKSISFGMKGRPYELLQQLNLRFDVLILGSYASSAAIGIYSIGVMLAEFIWYPSSSVSWALFPSTAAEEVAGSRVSRTLTSCRIVLAVTVVVAALIMTVAWVAITPIWGQDFAGARRIVIILLPGSLLFPLSITLSAGLAGSGWPHLSSLIAAASFVFTLVGDLILIPNHGIVGAAVASSTAYVISGLVAVAIFSLKTGSKPLDTIVLRAADFASIKPGIVNAWSSIRRLALADR